MKRKNKVRVIKKQNIALFLLYNYIYYTKHFHKTKFGEKQKEILFWVIYFETELILNIKRHLVMYGNCKKLMVVLSVKM